jgi:hypothetical protein
MSSFTLSSKRLWPFGAALVVIVLIEAAVAFALRPNIVERSKFNLFDRFQDTVVFGKLAEFVDSSPDIVQVGDSSGFYGVRPDVVMRYLGGLKYFNLSCCGGIGFETYYAMIEFMLKKNPNIKAVVVYISLRDLPRADSVRDHYQFGDFITNSLTTPFAYLSPPTVALRQRIVDMVERKRQWKLEATFTDELRQSFRKHNGWWAEHDRRIAGAKRAAYWREICEADIAALANHNIYYEANKRSYVLSEFQRFASLAARYGAKFVVMFHPYSCPGLNVALLDRRREELRTLVKQNANMVVLPENVLEIWPTEKFTTADHLRVGYDEENSRRVGKLLAPVFGLAPPSDAPDAGSDGTIRGDVLPTISEWTSDGAVVTAEDGTADAYRLVESGGPSPHRVETTVSGLVPGRTAVLSFPAKAIGARGVLVEMQAAERRGGGYCDLYDTTAQRDGDMLDAGLEPELPGWWRCWVAIVVNHSSATLRLSVINERLDPTYTGDSKSGAAVGRIELHQTSRFLAQEASPW